MSATRTIEFSEEVYGCIEEQAVAHGSTPAEWIVKTMVPESFVLSTSSEGAASYPDESAPRQSKKLRALGVLEGILTTDDYFREKREEKSR